MSFLTKVLLVILLGLIFAASQIPRFFDQKTRFVFCDVGEGDGAAIITPKNVFLIDAGRNSKMRDCLARHLPFWRRKITGVILTHPDADHVNGLKSVIQSYSVKYLFSNFSAKKNSDYAQIVDILRDSGVVVRSFTKGERISVNSSRNSGQSDQKLEVGSSKLDKEVRNLKLENQNQTSNIQLRSPTSNFQQLTSGISIQSLWPLNTHSESAGATNLFSTVSVITIGESRFLMLADSEISTQIELLPKIIEPDLHGFGTNDFHGTDNTDPRNRFSGNPASETSKQIRENPSRNGGYLAVKLSHHGSSKNFSYTLTRETRPKYAIISVGQNKYGHPSSRVIELLKSAGVEILRTDKLKDPSTSAQGYDIVFECEETCVLVDSK